MHSLVGALLSENIVFCGIIAGMHNLMPIMKKTPENPKLGDILHNQLVLFKCVMGIKEKDLSI
jgi:hypothetical protein